jgi:hypothetical protein
VERVSSVINDLGSGLSSIAVTVRLSNLGTRIISSAKLFATLGSGAVIVEDWTGILTTGQSINYTFSAKFVTASNTPKTFVCVRASDVNNGETEVRTDNNQQCNTLTGNIQVSGPTPNPSTNFSILGIIIPEEGPVKIAIVDLQGNYVLNEAEFNLPAGKTDYQIPIDRLRVAEYFISIKYNDEKIVRKLVVGK